MAKGARSKRVKRNNTAKRERLAKFENQKLEIISKKLNELIYGEQDEMSIEGLPKLQTESLKSIAEVIVDNNSDKKESMDVENEKKSEVIPRRRRSTRRSSISEKSN